MAERRVSTFEELVRTGRGNCLTISLFGASIFAATGSTQWSVLVAGGALMRKPLIVRAGVNVDRITAHAWLVERSPQPTLIDPIDKVPEIVDAGVLESRIRRRAPVDYLITCVIDIDGVKAIDSIPSCYQYLSEGWSTRRAPES